MIRTVVAVLFAIAAAHTTAPAVEFRVDGYAKNFLLVQRLPEAGVTGGGPFDAVGGQTLLADNLRARLNLRFDAADRLAAHVSYNLIPRVQNDDAAALGAAYAEAAPAIYRVDDLRPTIAPANPGRGDNLVLLQNLDRAYVSVRAPRFDVYVGRQAIAWGSARAINPTDVIAPFLFTEIDTEDRVGVDAARIRVPLGSLQELDIGWVLAPGSYKTHAFYLRSKGYAFNTDVSLLLMTFKQHMLVGFDLARSVFDAGGWLEAAWVANREEFLGSGEHLFTRGDNYWRISAGLDYSLTNATYLFIEYHHNDAGFADPSHYGGALGSTAYTDGAVYLLGRHYLISGATYPATALFALGGQLLLNISDGSALVAPSAEWNAAENVYVSAGAFVGVGKESELTVQAGVQPQDIGPDDARIRSEFGNYVDTYFASVRYYF